MKRAHRDGLLYRGMKPKNVYAGGNDAKGVYTGVFDDKMAVVGQDADGTKDVKDFTANTDPTEKRVASVGRLNNEGVREAGRLLRAPANSGLMPAPASTKDNGRCVPQRNPWWTVT